MGPISESPLTFHLVSIKFLANFVIFCKSAHQNNSNYVFLLMAIYLYFSGAKIDIITFFNYLGILINFINGALAFISAKLASMSSNWPRIN